MYIRHFHYHLAMFHHSCNNYVNSFAMFLFTEHYKKANYIGQYNQRRKSLSV